MKTLELSKANMSLADYARQKNGQTLILTSRGKPIAAVINLRGLDAESIAVSNDPTFLRIIEESRESHRKHGGISSSEMRRRLGLSIRKARNTTNARKSTTRKHKK